MDNISTVGTVNTSNFSTIGTGAGSHTHDFTTSDITLQDPSNDILTLSGSGGMYLTPPPAYDEYVLNFDKIRTVKDIVKVLRAMDLRMQWETSECPEQFKEINDLGFLIKKEDVKN